MLTLAAVLASAPCAVALEVAPAVAAPVVTTIQPDAPVAPTPRRHHAKGDPLEGFNRVMFAVHQTFDRLFFRPASQVYEKVVPKLLRKGLRHFFSNIREPVVFVNDVLQLKPKRAIKTLGRFTVNSTIGIAGVLDVAKTRDFKLPHHDNSFGNTLGRYGIGPGPYIFLPLVGPTDFRDFAGAQADTFGLRFGIGSPYDRAEFITTEAIVTGLDLRAESEGALKALLGGAVDPYATLRSAFLQDRAASIAELRHGGKATVSPLDDPLTDPAGEPPVEPPAEPPAAAPTGDAPPAPAELPVVTSAPAPPTPISMPTP